MDSFFMAQYTVEQGTAVAGKGLTDLTGSEGTDNQAADAADNDAER